MADLKETAQRNLPRVCFYVVMCISFLFAYLLGVEKKTLLERFTDIFLGGTFGAGLGLAFFLLVGGIGFVSGPIFGSLGVISLAIGGGLGGLGLGSIAHVLRNPGQYNFDWPLILCFVLGGYLLARFTSKLVRKQLQSETASQVIQKN